MNPRGLAIVLAAAFVASWAVGQTTGSNNSPAPAAFHGEDILVTPLGPPESPEAEVESAPLSPPVGADSEPAEPAEEGPGEVDADVEEAVENPDGAEGAETVTDVEEPGESAPPVAVGPVAVLRGLDKVSGIATNFEVPVGDERLFGRLLVRVMACNGRQPDEIPESAAFVQIRDPGREDEMLFSGWMFASSPGLSAMDHARYDVWVISCRSV